jgi:hypothetical protein
MNAPKKIIKKVREQLILSAEQKREWIVCYESTGKLPQINIPCSKCHLGITAGHENLRNKVAKYKGIANLLDTFVCKDCKDPVPKKESQSKPVIKRIKTRSNDVIERDQSGRFIIPQVKMHRDNPVYTMLDIAKSKHLTQEFTNGTCMQPHVYLNNDSTCDACPLFDNCGCSVKKLSKSMQRRLSQI